MQMEALKKIFGTLNKENVRYLIAGGLAVVAHGYVRFTADIDMILQMEPNNLKISMKLFDSIGYRPRAPVKIDEFVDPEKRSEWIKNKGLTVFSLWNPDYPATEIDIFVKEPIPFDEAYKNREYFEIADGINVTVIGLDDLIEIKKLAGRQRDIEDIEKLNALRAAETND